MDAMSESRVIRAPSRRRGRNDEQLCDRIKLKKVLGLTVCSNAALDVSPISGLLAYPAGCTVILFNAKKQTQVYLVNTSRKAFTSVAFSRCGRYVATGECGINPAIKVWELDSPNGNLENTTGGTVVAEFVDHKYAVTCVAFSPTGKYLVSVGSQHDMIVNVFEWKSSLKMASNKVSAKVSAVSFAEDGSYFVTVGNRHVKYWYLEGGRKYKDPIPLMGRSAILGELRNNDFCAVACGKGECIDSTYAITRLGHLVEFNSRRLLDKWVQCRTTSANCICVNGQFILVGCAESIIRIFNAVTLEYITTLPRTHYLGVDVAQGIHINHIMTVPHNAKYPDTIAMVYDEARAKVSCVYNDHSLYIWDMRDIKRVGKSHSFLYHSTCIWGVETVPYNIDRAMSHTLPEDCFLTCSSDDTIRVWGLNGCANNDIYRKNIYSKELLKVVYIDDELNFIKDSDNSVFSSDKSPSYDGRNGVRCIKISPELNHLASGDRSGNIRIYNLSNLKLVTTIEAHESEVLCLEYSNDKIDRKLLGSASRDRLIHVFDVSQDYLLLQTLDDHSSSITSIKFIGSGMNFQMISCGADKSIMFRTFHNNMFLRGTNCSGKTTLYDMEVDSNSKHILTACQDRNIRVYGTQNMKHTKTFKGSHSDDGSLIKLSLDPSGIYIATSCTDKTLAVYDYYSNECMARMYGHSELVTGLKFTNDCKHLISASGDGCIFVWQVPHDMIVTMQARLSQQRLRSGHPPLARPISVNANTDIIIESPTSDEHVMIDELPLTPGYKFSDVGQLPQWAKRKAAVNADSVVDTHQAVTAAVAVAAASQQSISNLSSSPSQVIGVPKARGRWAQRGQIDSDALDIRSNSESPLGITTPAYSSTAAGNTQTSDYNSGSSKDIMYNQTYLSEDSSIDSGMETRREIKFSGSNNSGISASNSGRITTDKKKNAGFRFESNNDHDGDVEDISDGERTSSEHGMFYTNISPATPTDFKVTAMNEEELRKSVRRQKFEKVGLNLSAGNGSSHTASTGTGTGTSDTEDEGSTPSGENADRSLASTLGGSSESIPQTSSSFLQAALDGPGTVLERGSSGRRSISAKHNNESNKSVPTITKSYTSTKKEELLKVISEAKQKLENGQRKNGIKKLNAIPEVGYRPLRGSHSISDLSLAGTLEGSRPTGTPNRYTKTDVLHSNSNNTKTPTTNAQHFFNCAAPKSVLLKNCQAMRQVHQNYPPYPRHIGVYNSQSQQSSSQNFQKTSTLTTASQSKQCPGGASPQKCLPSSHLSLKSLSSKSSSAKCTNLEISTKPVDGEKTQHAKSPTSNTRKNYSILKNYKSCPVSPVHEEIDWRNLPRDSNNIIFTEPKRHSVYSDDAKTILDMIHSDTEKMIEEITRKYGDLDEVPRNQQLEKNLELSHPESGTTKTSKEDPSSSKDEDSNFSSDSLENCSLDLDYDQKPHPHPRKKKSVCRKHQKSRNAVPPKRSASEYYIFQEYYQTSVHRNVSLSDILNDGNEAADDRTEEAKFLETQRHSSASFFLTSQYPEYPEQKSQESLLSEELFDESYCNSMESILSDESDCKSAPLEMLFDKTSTTKKISNPYTSFIQGQLDNALVSKSYGSSPNAYNSFDYYMQQKSLHSSPYDSFDVSSYNLDNFCDNKRKIKPYKKKSHNERLQSSETYPRLADYQAKSPITTTDDEQIPTLSFKNEQYSSGVNKSLSKDFAYQRNRKQHKSNPISSALDSDEYENFLFSKKVVKPKPPIPAKPQNLTSTLSTHEMRATTTTCGDIKSCSSSSPSPSIKKSCSFDIDTKDLRNKSRTASVVQKFEKNLKKFENEKENEQKLYQGMLRPSVSSGALATSCLKKTSKFSGSSGGYPGTTQCTATGTPAAPSRRASSMRSRSRPKISVRFNTVSQIKYTPNERRSSSCSSPSSASATTTTTRLLNDINSNATTLQQYHHHDHVHNLHRNEPLPELPPPPPRPSSSSSSTAHFSDYEEKSFEMYIAENGNEHENNMDSLKLYIKPENSSLQSVAAIADIDEMHYDKSKKNLENEKTLDTSTSNQCKNIAKKIDLINKLIEMEERKLEQIRLATESRMKPFECNSKKKGYVKSLTMNFDMLARGIEKDIENERKKQAAADAADSRPSDGSSYFRMKRNVSLPDVLESTKMKTYNDDANNDNNTEEHESEKIRNDCDEKDKGNPKSLLPMPIEESSIRRACSLSDLHMGNMGKANNKSMNLTPGQLQKSGVIHRASSASRSASKRNSLQGLKGLSGSGLGSQQQSTSMSVLIQGSDSETEDTNRGLLRSSGSGQNRSNGPIAAARQYGNKTSATNSSRRKGVQNFNNASGQQDDSSSEETQGGSSAHSGKPIVPPRPRNLPIDHKKAILNSSNVVKSRGIYEAGDFPLRDIEGSENSSQVYNVINKLFTTTTAAVQLHAKLKNTEDSTSSSNNLMLKELENALIMAQNMLTNITNKNEKTNLQHMSPSAYSTGEQATLENGDYLTMVNNCADLLSNVRSKHKSDDCENNA